MESTPSDLQLLDSQVLSRIGHLELVSQRLVDGILTGHHRSKHQGGVFEFAEHREYSAGDEIRLIDWRVFAKCDRYYIKRFEEETNLQVILVIDASGSMDFKLSTLSKLDYARVAGACLSRLILRQRDAVGLSVINQSLDQFIPPRGNARHLQAICEALRTVNTVTNVGPRAVATREKETSKSLERRRRLRSLSGATGDEAPEQLRKKQPPNPNGLSDGLLATAQRIHRRGIFLVWTDGFGDRPRLMAALQGLRQRGHEVILMHVLAPEETTFQFEGWSRFECMEVGGRRIDLDPVEVRKRYLEKFGQFLIDIKRDCLRMGCDYRLIQTDRPIGEAIAEFLHRRMAKSMS